MKIITFIYFLCSCWNVYKRTLIYCQHSMIFFSRKQTVVFFCSLHRLDALCTFRSVNAHSSCRDILTRAYWCFAAYSARREPARGAFGAARRDASRRVARMSQLRYQAAYCLVALYLVVYRPDRWQPRVCNVNRNVGFGRLLHAIPPSAPSLFIDGTSVPSLPHHPSSSPWWTPRSGVDPVHVQVVIKITCMRAMPFGDPRTLPEGLHGCKLDRHLHRVNCETALFANYSVLWTRRTRLI